MPERDIESLGVMGLGLRRPGDSSAAAVVVAVVAHPPEGPVGTGWIQGERSELRYALAS